MTDAAATDKPFACDLCSEAYDKPFKLGLHKKRAHGIEGTSKKTTARKAARHAHRPAPVRVLREAADDLQGRGAPSSSQLTGAFGRALYTVSTTVAVHAVEGDPTVPSDEDKESAVDYLTLPRRSAEDVMEPVGRVFAGTAINRRYGRQIVDNVDVVSSACELSLLFVRWRKYFRDRDARLAQLQQYGAPPAATPPPPPPRGVTPEPPSPNGAAKSPAPTEGVIVTRKMLEEMRASHG